MPRFPLPRPPPQSPECQLMGPVVQARELGSLAPVRAAQVSGVPGLGFPGAAQVPGTPGLGSPGATQGPGAPGLGSPGPACGVTLPEAGSSLKTTRPAKEDAFYSRGRNRNQKFLFLEAEKKKAFWEAHMVQHRHYGARTTCTHLRKKYYWPGMALDVKKWVKMCRKCLDKSIRIAAHNALEAGSQQAPQGDGRMDHFPLTQEQGLFTFVSLQLLGPLQQTPRGFCFAFVAVDYFTKWVRAAPMHSCSVRETSAQILELVKRFGLPEGIISTASSSFILQINKFLKMALKMQNSLVVKYNPQTDGCLKSIRSFVIRILSLVLTMNPTDWDHHLHKVFFLQNRCSDYSEEEDEDDLRKLHGESPGAAWAPPPQVPELPQPSPESQKEPPAKGRGEDTCLYCCRLPDEGDSDVFAVVQCDRCPAWAHEQCVWRQLGRVDPKISFRCKTCLLAVVGAQPEPQTSRALGAGDGGAGSVGPSWGPGPQHGPGVPGHQLPTFQVAGGP
uniref:Integrase catalytic domain-containing protein n=1 Tax=Sarcophilus harrisii TaxID=9305 RepID=A0A7N4PMK6_SARHA